MTPLRTYCLNLFGEESIGATSKADLDELIRFGPSTLVPIEQTLKIEQTPIEREPPQILSRLNRHRDTWQSAYEKLKSEVTFLGWLTKDDSCGIPKLVEELAATSHFRALGDAEHESSTVMAARSRAATEWLSSLGTASRPSTERRFFQHFVIDAPQAAASRSVLFRHFVSVKRKAQPSKDFADVNAFATALGEIHSHLKGLLNVKLSFNDLMVIGNVLNEKSRDGGRELQLLSAFYDPGKQLGSNNTQQLRTVLQLGGLRSDLERLTIPRDAEGTGQVMPGTLERFGFRCANVAGDGTSSDPDYARLKELAASLGDPTVTQSWDPVESSRRLAQAHELLQTPRTPEEHGIEARHSLLLGMLSLFDQLAQADKVWEFVHSHKDQYVQTSGEGYTSEFAFKIEELLLHLGGEDYKIVENFKPVVFWVSILVANQHKPFRELMVTLWASESIASQAKEKLPDARPFSQLKTANEHMDLLSDLFVGNGLGGLDRVLPQFEAISACSVYIFDLQRQQLRLAYIDERKKAWTRLAEEEVLDFEQRLGFVQREENAQQHNIAPHLVAMQEYRRALALMCELHALGHPKFSNPICGLAVGTIPEGALTAKDLSVKITSKPASKPASQPASQPEERRLADDGKHYTKAEFYNYYGSYKEWDAAAQQRPSTPPERSLGKDPMYALDPDFSIKRITSHEISPEALDVLCKDWMDDLGRILEKNKLLCLFSSRVAQRMAKIISKLELEEKAWADLALLISPLFPAVKVNVAGFKMLVEQILPAWKRSNKNAAEHWPAKTAEFLENVMLQMKAKNIASAVDHHVPPGAAALILSDAAPIRYTSPPSHSILIRLLLHIYDGRPPEPFEVLWCDNSTMPHMVRAFLERAKHHPRRTFTLLQVDLIAHTVQHALLKLFLASRDVAAGQLRVGHNVRCVETGPCALQSASWIRLESAEEVCEPIDLATLLPRFAVGGCKASVTCFVGPAGSGKTHQLRKRASATSGAAHHCTLSITEAFSVGDAAYKLHEAALASVGKSIVLSVFINVGKFKHSERSQWSSLMERVNKLFFGLLVLGSVEDPLSNVVFNMPPGSQLQLLVEIPDRDAHLEPPPNEAALSAAERNARDRRLLWEELPVIAAASTFVYAAAQAFEIDERAKHVCKYLKAYDDTLNGRPGGIDQQYGAGAGGEKAVMFVLDSSGSMEGPRIDTCKRSLLNDIFSKRLSENDHVGFFAFSNTISNEVSMDRWSGAHRSTLENTVRGIRATGGTDLWTAMNYACVRIGTHPCQTKWIVALTDGESGGSPEQTKQLLRSAHFKGVRVLFVTVDISHQYLQIIKDAVVRAPGDAVISANGGTAALEQAWREVGEKLTVSQKIERAGATITDAECTQLLHKYMRLDGTHREWTRLKQTHWITYLFRRCKILAASDKFNKNKEFAKFGSTTMKIMLEEVTACPQP